MDGRGRDALYGDTGRGDRGASQCFCGGGDRGVGDIVEGPGEVSNSREVDSKITALSIMTRGKDVAQGHGLRALGALATFRQVPAGT